MDNMISMMRTHPNHVGPVVNPIAVDTHDITIAQGMANMSVA